MAGPWVITVVSFGEPRTNFFSVAGARCSLPLSLSLVAVSAASTACVNGLATIQRKCGPLVSRWRGRRDERVAEVVATAPEPLLPSSSPSRPSLTPDLITYCFAFFRAFAKRSSNPLSFAAWTWRGELAVLVLAPTSMTSFLRSSIRKWYYRVIDSVIVDRWY